MANSPKGRFNWIAGPDALPVLSRETVKSHQFIPVLLQAERGFRVLGFIGQQEQIECLLGLLAGISLRIPVNVNTYSGLT